MLEQPCRIHTQPCTHYTGTAACCQQVLQQQACCCTAAPLASSLVDLQDILNLDVRPAFPQGCTRSGKIHACCRIERRQQFVQRRVRLPESADMTAITAKMDNGTLVIDIPKNPDKVQQRQIDVK